VIRLEDDDERRRARIEALPDFDGIFRRRKRVEQRDLAARLDAGRRNERFPVEPRNPLGMLDAPKPETGRDVAKLVSHSAHRARGGGTVDPSPASH
jgi:hypothetical protein